jgi:hypothetical protein
MKSSGEFYGTSEYPLDWGLEECQGQSRLAGIERNFYVYLESNGARGRVVIEALYYKLEGRGLETR